MTKPGRPGRPGSILMRHPYEFGVGVLPTAKQCPGGQGLMATTF